MNTDPMQSAQPCGCDEGLTPPHYCERHREDRMKLNFAIECLRNVGVDTTCGACMEAAFTGATNNAHSCKQDRPQIEVTLS